MNRLRRSIIHLGIASAALLALASCSAPKSSMTYFENVPAEADYTAAAIQAAAELRIVPDDELLINITSTTPGAALIFSNSPLVFNQVDARTGTLITQPSSTESLYRVDKKGDISFPVFGRLHVAGMTLMELADELTVRIGREIENPTVTVELKNFHVNVMGEVKKPGPVLLEGGQRISVLDAIAAAEDMTPYGIREDVIVVREQLDGTRTVHHLNLNDVRSLEDPYFILAQNDVVIVRPNEIAKSNGRYDTNKSYKVQVTSAVISACSVIASLVIALCIK